MNRKFIAVSLAISALTASSVLPTSSAEAQWRGGYGRGGYGYGGYGHGYRGYGVAPFVGGALLGLGVGTLLAPRYIAPPPVVYAPPPPAYYPPPAYAYAPYGYAPPPPAYYAPY